MSFVFSSAVSNTKHSTSSKRFHDFGELGVTGTYHANQYADWVAPVVKMMGVVLMMVLLH